MEVMIYLVIHVGCGLLSISLMKYWWTKDLDLTRTVHGYLRGFAILGPAALIVALCLCIIYFWPKPKNPDFVVKKRRKQ